MAKYKDYQDYDRFPILLSGIDDIQPYHITLPDAPKPSEIINYGLEPKDQYFKRVFIPPAVRRLNYVTRAEAFEAASKNPDIGKFVRMMWDKRMNGEFQYINGVPTYITGLNWFYLNFFPVDGQILDYRDTDKQYWYWRQFCVIEDTECYGGVLFTNRRSGKSAKAGCEMLEHATRTRNTGHGIQSKSDDDAKAMFKNFIVNPWRKLPWFFAPIFDGNTNPTEKIEFIEPRSSGKKDMSDIANGAEPLESWINFQPNVPIAYDGRKLHKYILDEAGKFEKGDPKAVWDKVKMCLKMENLIIGKALITTTVEEMEKGGGAKFKKIWDDSDTAKRNNIGQTVSGLVPFFIPAKQNYLFGAYGESIVGDPTAQQQKYLYDKYIVNKKKPDQAKALSKMGAEELLSSEEKGIEDYYDRLSFVRKYPNTIKSAFTSSFKGCHFDKEKLDAQIEILQYSNPYIVRRGNFEWLGNKKDTRVIFTECKDGKFEVSYLPPDEKTNLRLQVGDRFAPAVSSKCYLGCDPYKVSFTTDGRGSKAGIHIWMDYDEEIDRDNEPHMQITEDFIVHYLHRAKSGIEEFFEDILMACVFYNCLAFIENNTADALNKYFYDRGYDRYLRYQTKAKKKGGRVVLEQATQPGVHNAGDQRLKQELFREIDWYVLHCMHHCKFVELPLQYLDVEMDTVTKFDAFVSSALARKSANMVVKRMTEQKQQVSSPVRKRVARIM